MMDRISAPFTPMQVAQLHQFQFGPWAHPFTREPKDAPLRMHPFTCPNRSDHPTIAVDRGILVPTTRGWICQCCDYTQGWAHRLMAGEHGSTMPAPTPHAPVEQNEAALRDAADVVGRE